MARHSKTAPNKMSPNSDRKPYLLNFPFFSKIFKLFLGTAVSQFGNMLVKQCKEEGIPLVNVARKEGAVEVLEAIGAEFVVNSFLPSFKEDLLAGVKATEATVAFDATGGGTLATDIAATVRGADRPRPCAADCG